MQNFIEDLVHHARECIKNKAFIKTETGHSLDLTEVRDIVKQSLQALKAHMIQEFESRVPIDKYHTGHLHEEDRLVASVQGSWGGKEVCTKDFADGFNECRSIILEEINKLKNE